ncbi:hypothetical protein CGG93_25235, partial [Vibrio parahaemolyticus]
NTQNLLVPKFIAKERVGEYALLSQDELLSLLICIDSFINQHQSNFSKEQSSSCDKMIEFVITSARSNVEIDISTFFQRCSHLKLFKVDSIGATQKT